METTRRLLGDYLETTWRVLGDYLETTWRLLGDYLEITWRLLADYLETTWRRLAVVPPLLPLIVPPLLPLIVPPRTTPGATCYIQLPLVAHSLCVISKEQSWLLGAAPIETGSNVM